MNTLNSNEFYFYTFFKRLKDNDYRMAFQSYFPKDFIKKPEYSDRLINHLNGLFSNWLLKNFFNRGGWKKRLWFVDQQYKRNYAWDYDIKFDLSSEIFNFYRQILGLWYKESIDKECENVSYSPSDLILIHVFTQEILERKQTNFINVFTPCLRTINLNSFLFGDIFLNLEIDFDSLSEEECFYLQGANEVVIRSFTEWCQSLRYKSPCVIIQDLEFVTKKLNSIINRIVEHKDWWHLFYLVEIYEQVIIQDLLNTELYLLNASNSDFEDEIAKGNYLMDVADAWERFQTRFQRMVNSFHNISFVDPNYEHIKEFIRVLKRHHTPYVKRFDEQLQGIYQEVERINPEPSINQEDEISVDENNEEIEIEIDENSEENSLEDEDSLTDENSVVEEDEDSSNDLV